MIADVYGATSCTMTEVGGAANSTMQVCGAITSTFSNTIR